MIPKLAPKYSQGIFQFSIQTPVSAIHKAVDQKVPEARILLPARQSSTNSKFVRLLQTLAASR